MVAHKSGGPMMDIIIHSKGSQPIGFLASDEIEYADILCKILRMKPDKRELVREAARYLKTFGNSFYLAFFLCLILKLGTLLQDFRTIHLRKNS